MVHENGATVQLFALDPILGNVSSSATFELKLPKKYEALATKYRKLHEAWRDEIRKRISVAKGLETYKRAEEKRRKYEA